MTEENLEEQFPSLKGKFNLGVQNLRIGKFSLLHAQDVQKFCLDKQRVKEILDKSAEKYDFGDSHWGFLQFIDDLSKELGLEEEN